MSTKSPSVIIIGCGIIGAMSAYFLSREGCTVTMIDKNTFASGASHGNCGFIVPSHALPLARPGAIKSIFPQAFNRKSPFYIKPRLDVSLIKWCWQFIWHCRQAGLHDTALARQALLNQSQKLYRQIIAEHNIDCNWEENGCLFIYRKVKSFEHAKQEAIYLQKLGIDVTVLSAHELEILEPEINPGTVSGGLLFPQDSQLRPDQFMAAMQGILLKLGVQIIENEAIHSFVTTQNTVSALKTSAHEYKADKFVISCGAETPQLAAQLGVKISIQPGKGYSLTSARPKNTLHRITLFVDDKVAISPYQDSIRVGSIMEFVGYDKTVQPDRIRYLEKTADYYLKSGCPKPFHETWAGWRPMTPNGLPILDRVPRYENTWVAAGHNMMGMSMGPASGQLMANLILRQKPLISPDPYRLKTTAQPCCAENITV